MQSIARSPGVWLQAWGRLKDDRVGMVCLWITLLYLALVVVAQLGLVASNWQKEVGAPFAPPHFVGKIVDESQTAVVQTIDGPAVDLTAVDPLAPYYKEWQDRASKFKSATVQKSDTLAMGGDQFGRDVMSKVIKGAQVSITVGLAAALFATVIGTVLGALGGYFGGKTGDLLEWIYNVFTAIPYILLVFALAAVIKAGPLAKVIDGVWTVVIILSLVGWTGIYRLVRGEYMKHRSREYVLAAEAIGASHWSRMFVHILPNVSHVVLVQLSLHVVGFIKAEVILSFLGLGVPIDMVSWGTMLSEAQSELVLGKWWQLAAATFTMAVFVTAFAVLTDSLRDALDPKLR